MGFKVILTPQSLDDLREIVSFIAQQNPARAKSFGHELIDHALTLAELPELGRIAPEISEPSVREIVHRPYRIIYGVFPSQNTVYVLRFWRGARGEPEIKLENSCNPNRQSRRDKLTVKTANDEFSAPLTELHGAWWNSIARAM